VIELKEIFKGFKTILGNHLDLANFIISRFENAVSYPLACSVTIEELILDPECFFDDARVALQKSESEELFADKQNLYWYFTENQENPKELTRLFHALKDSWDLILGLREEYSTLFDFRFLCHAQELPKEKIDQLLNPKTAQLISFIPSPKYPACLFMMGTIQTLAKIQNKILEE
jgi:hypothetical protein